MIWSGGDHSSRSSTPSLLSGEGTMKFSIDQLKKLGPPITVRKSGAEEVHICPSCGKPKLHINRRKGVWYCFREGVGGTMPMVVPLGAASPQLRAREQAVPIDLPEPHLSLWASQSLTASIYREYLEERGLEDWQIMIHAFTTSDPDYWGRVILRGHNNYWVARKVIGDGPPYINPPGPKLPWLSNPNIIRCEVESKPTIVVEGVFDALAVSRVGYRCLALLGNEVFSEAIRVLEEESRVIVLLDSLTFGASWEAFMKLGSTVETRTVFTDELFPGYKDPAEVPAQLLKEKLGGL